MATEQNTISPEEKAYRERCLNDFRRFSNSNNIPPALQERILTGTTPDARSAVLELTILALQAGRLLELEDSNALDRARLEFNKPKKVDIPPLLKGLLDVEGRELRTKQREIETLNSTIVLPNGKLN